MIPTIVVASGIPTNPMNGIIRSIGTVPPIESLTSAIPMFGKKPTQKTRRKVILEVQNKILKKVYTIGFLVKKGVRE